jgi:hypothetical protein
MLTCTNMDLSFFAVALKEADSVPTGKRIGIVQAVMTTHTHTHTHTHIHTHTLIEGKEGFCAEAQLVFCKCKTPSP